MIQDEISMFQVQSLESKLPRYWKNDTTSMESLFMQEDGGWGFGISIWQGQ